MCIQWCSCCAADWWSIATTASIKKKSVDWKLLFCIDRPPEEEAASTASAGLSEAELYKIHLIRSILAVYSVPYNSRLVTNSWNFGSSQLEQRFIWLFKLRNKIIADEQLSHLDDLAVFIIFTLPIKAFIVALFTWLVISVPFAIRISAKTLTIVSLIKKNATG